MPGKRRDAPIRYYAILQYKGIIFAAGLKGDKFKRYLEFYLLRSLLLNRYFEFELGIKKADKQINYR